MSTPSGDAEFVADAIAQAKALLTEAQADELRQADMFQPTPEEMLLARQDLGPEAGRLAMVQHAREKRRGRPAGAKNKRTDDFARYILGFGQHPAITMMQIQATPPELLIEASRQERVHSFRGDGTPNVVIERLSYAEAQALRIRCAEGVLPFIESKKPIAVDHSFAGVADMMIEGVTHTREEMDEARRMKEAVDGEFYEVADDAPAGELPA